MSATPPVNSSSENTGTGSPAARKREFLWHLLFPLLAAVLLWDVLFGGQVLLPTRLAYQMLPWRALPEAEALQIPWNVLAWDGAAQFYPWRAFAAESVRGGSIPLWNPYAFAGTPFLANSQSAPLYPLHWLYYLPGPLDTAHRMGWLAALHLSLAGVFTHLWARSEGLRPFAAACAGVVFMQSGFVVTWLELPSFLNVACWIPLALLCLGKAYRRGSWGRALAAGAALGMMLLGGHLQIALYGMLAVGLWTLWHAVPAWRAAGGPRRVLRIALVGIVALGIGLALSAPQVLPSLELSRLSHRFGPPTPEGYQAYLRLAMPVHHLVTLFAPDYFGHPLHNDGDYWGHLLGVTNYAEYAGYIGIVGLLAAGIGLRRRPAFGQSFALVLAGVALLLALGTPLNAVLYHFVPGFSQTGSPARVLVLFCLGGAMLAAYGVDALMRWSHAEGDNRRALKGVMVAAGAVALLFAITYALAVNATGRLPANAVPAATAIARPALLSGALLLGIAVLAVAGVLAARDVPRRAEVVAAAVMALLLADLTPFARGYNPTSPEAFPRTPLTEFLQARGGRVLPLNSDWQMYAPPKALLPPNTSMAYGLRSPQGYDSLFLGRFKAFANAVEGSDASPPANGNMIFFRQATRPLLPLLATPTLVSSQPQQASGLREVFRTDGAWVYEDARALPEAYLVSEVRAADDREALEALVQVARGNPTRLGQVAYVPTGAAMAPGPLGTGTATLRQHGPNRIIVEVDATAPGVLVVAEGYHPAWRATVSQGGSGGEAPVVRANIAFIAVAVPAGRSVVELRFAPDSYRVGLFLALLAVAVLAAGGTAAVAGTVKRGR